MANKIWHYVAGFVTGLWGFQNGYVTGGGISLFLSYQIWQDFCGRPEKRPDSYKDIREFTVGWFIGTGLAWGLANFTRG